MFFVQKYNIKICSWSLPFCDWTASILVLLVVICFLYDSLPLAFLIVGCLLDRPTGRFSRHWSSLLFSAVVDIFWFWTALVIFGLLCSGGYILAWDSVCHRWCSLQWWISSGLGQRLFLLVFSWWWFCFLDDLLIWYSWCCFCWLVAFWSAISGVSIAFPMMFLKCWACWLY